MENSVFNFTDYKAFIRTLVSRGVFKRMAEHLEVNSTMISQIMAGEKDFTLEQGERLLSFFNLKDVEAEYFLLLIQIERAGTESLKNFYRKRLNEVLSQSLSLKNRLQVDRDLTAEEKSTFYSSWVYSAVQIFTSIGAGQSFEALQKEFNIERHRLEDILNFLVSTKLCTVNAGIFKPGVQSTHVEKGSPFLVQHHTNWRVKAIERVEKLSDAELMFTANLTLSREDFPVLRELLIHTIKGFTEKIKESPSEIMANLNIDFFLIK
jgi:uncharacterized protein (TIGR02147 family)